MSVILIVSSRSLIIPPPAVVFALEYISQKGRSGWQYLASYGALRYALSLVRRSVLTTGKAKAEEHRSHSEWILNRDTKMWPLYCQTARVQFTKDYIETRCFLCSACLHRWPLGPVLLRLSYSPPHSHPEIRTTESSFFFFFGWEREGNASCTLAPKRRVWDSNRARQWAYMPVWTVCPVVLPTKNPPMPVVPAASR
jgi:hypothetical protein